MPIIAVTRLRLRDPSLLDEFFTHAAAVLEQAQTSSGNLGADALAEAHDVWWSVTAWHDRPQMDAFVNAEPHSDTEGLLDHLCDEATFVDWEKASAELPDWQTRWRHLVADGQSAPLTHQSEANQTRAFPAPVEPPASLARPAPALRAPARAARRHGESAWAGTMGRSGRGQGAGAIKSRGMSDG